MDLLKNQVALVTGGSKGIGFAIARKLAQQGATVYIVDIDEEHLNQAEETLIKEGLKVHTFNKDITKEKEVSSLFEKIKKDSGKLDILINNAGIIRDNFFYKMSAEDWDAVMEVHLKGTFLCCKNAENLMVENRYGRIINLSSVSALGTKGQANYAAAKAGIQGFTKTLALELGKFNITVNSVAPGFIQTDMTKAVAERLNITFEELVSKKLENISVNRAGTPEDVAHAVLFFADPLSSFVNGQILYIAGGPKG